MTRFCILKQLSAFSGVYHLDVQRCYIFALVATYMDIFHDTIRDGLIRQRKALEESVLHSGGQ